MPAIPQIAPPPLPDRLTGFTVRPPTVADVDALYRLCAANDTAIVGEPTLTVAEVHQYVASPTADRDGRQAVIETGGAIVAWPGLIQIAPERLAGDIQLDPALDPVAADAIVSWALGWFEAIARENVPLTDDGRVQLQNWCYEPNTAFAQRLVAAGYERSRVFVRMRIALDAAPPEPDLDPRIVVRPARIDPDDPAHGEAVDVHEIITAAFADHFNYTPTEFGLWWERRRDAAGFDPSLWYLADLDGAHLGAMINYHEVEDGHDAGYVHYLGVLREGRGKGIAKALLARAFREFRARGSTEVTLHVDAASPTGATRLYESAGMTRDHVVIDWQKWITG